MSIRKHTPGWAAVLRYKIDKYNTREEHTGSLLGFAPTVHPDRRLEKLSIQHVEPRERNRE